jgi:stress response protein SCP2
VLVAIGQQRQKACAFNRGVELTLENRAGAGQTRRDDFAVFSDEIAQGVDVLVVDLFDAGYREAAKALALE